MNAMNVEFCVTQLRHNASRICELVQHIPQKQASWKPDPATWSILEVINHLYDEERLDFRARLDRLLHQPDRLWPDIDPEGWVTERHYNQRLFDESLNDFLIARRESLDWLASLQAPNWAAVYRASFGQLSAGDLLAAWVAHDLLHMRQLVELHWAYTTDQLSRFRFAYAGDW
jgi:hypothetical protein